MAKLELIQFDAKNGKKIILRSAQAGDGVAILESVRKIMSTSNHLLTQVDEFHYTPEQEDEMIREHLAHPDKIVIVPECDGQIIGMLDFRVGAKRRIAHVGLLGMSLLPEFRGIGIGEKMLRTFLAWAKKNPRVEKINLYVHAKNANAIKLYEKAGFHQEGREIKGVKHDDGSYDDSIQMTCFVSALE